MLSATASTAPKLPTTTTTKDRNNNNNNSCQPMSDIEIDVDVDDHDEHYSLNMDVQTASPSPCIGPEEAETDENVHQTVSSHDEDEATLLTLRLLHSSEDGGMLIGKDGCHINNLKESTNVSWRIHGNNTNQEDRVVVINGSIDNVAYAVRKLAEHIDQQQMTVDASSRHNDSDSLCLRFLFPGNCIGSILGPGGSRLSNIRQAEPEITWLHIYHGFVPHTNERIIEVVGPAQALGRVAGQLLQLSKESLTKYQDTSRLYRPVRNGLHRMISRERDIQNGSSSKNHRKGTTTSSFSNASGSDYGDDEEEDEGRKRSYSMLNPSKHMDVCNDEDRGYKRPRRLSDNTHSRRNATDHHHHHHRHHSSQHGNKHRANHNRNKSVREEKLVVPDNIAGRLIGRNGACLISMESQSGAQITLSPRVPNMHDRIVTVVGSSKDVSTACRLIKDKVHIFEDMEV